MGDAGVTQGDTGVTARLPVREVKTGASALEASPPGPPNLKLDRARTPKPKRLAWTSGPSYLSGSRPVRQTYEVGLIGW